MEGLHTVRQRKKEESLWWLTGLLSTLKGSFFPHLASVKSGCTLPSMAPQM